MAIKSIAVHSHSRRSNRPPSLSFVISRFFSCNAFDFRPSMQSFSWRLLATAGPKRNQAFGAPFSELPQTTFHNAILLPHARARFLAFCLTSPLNRTLSLTTKETGTSHTKKSNHAPAATRTRTNASQRINAEAAECTRTALIKHAESGDWPVGMPL